ncbi:MAG: hypothetical protein HW400_654 [Candidatus Levybacteria bacterium]|nr:hypothetical protein [Candidatus Levybacteria bacterium]
MLDPYRMIAVNLILSILLLLGIVVYKYIYPKRKINLMFLLVLISLLPLISVFRKGTYESGDLNIHVGFAMSFFESLKDGNLIPRWSSQMIYGYGYPLFLFIYPLPYYLASLFHTIGFTFINSFKIILIISYITSGIAMYLFVKEELKNKLSAFVAALFYLFAPYHLVDLHFRTAVGEVISFAILPFCFLTIKNLSNGITFRRLLLSSASISLLILSHQAISLITIPFIIIYCLYLFFKNHQKKLKFMFSCFFSLLMAILISSFYWFPVIFEAKYTNLLTKGAISFISFNQLIYSPWRWGFLFQGHMGELSFIIGYAHWFIILFSIFLFLKKTKRELREKKLYLISIGSFFTLLFLTQSISSPIWRIVPLLNGFQFSYRLLLLISFFVSIIAGIVIKNVPNKMFIIILCSIAVLTTILNWGNRKMLPLVTDSIILHGLSNNITKIGTGTTIWVNSDNFTVNNSIPHMIVLKGKADISETSRTSVKHTYLINVISQNVSIRENTLYFPNWNVRVNGKSHPFSFNSTDSQGVITFGLSKGLYIVDVSFTDTRVRKISLLVSVLSFIILLMFGLRNQISKALNIH